MIFRAGIPVAVITAMMFAACGGGSSQDGEPPQPPPSSTIMVPADFPSIREAIAAAPMAAQIVVSPGTYSETGTLTISSDLTLVSNYEVSGDENDIAGTIITGDGSNLLFVVAGGASLRIEGFTIRNTAKPITIDVGHGDIRNNIIRDNRDDAISFEGDSSGTASFNTIVNSGDDGIDIDGSRGPYEIQGNIILDSGDDGMEFRMIDAYLTSGPVEYEVFGNIIDGATGDGIQLIDYPTDNENRREIDIHHNLIRNVDYAGIGTMPEQMTQRRDLVDTYPNFSFEERVLVTNNTIVNNDNGVSGGDNFVVVNNIFANNRLGATSLDGNSKIDYAILFNNDLSGVPAGAIGGNLIYADPLLDADGELQNGSPAIDAGTSQYTWQGENVLNIPTFNGSAPDLGWVESGAN